MKTTTKLWLGIGILAILSPLGLILPEFFKAGGAWGEPESIPGYGFTNFSYFASAIIGIIVVALVALIIGKILSKKDRLIEKK